MISIEQLKRTRTVVIPWGDENISLTFIPRRWDAAFVERHNQMVEDESDGGRARYIYTLLSLLDGWDIQSEGETAQISEVLLNQFDDAVLLVLYLAIRRNIEEAEEKKSS